MLIIAISSTPAILPAAYDGYETWLHYSPVPESMKATYQNMCKSLVLCDNFDTMKNAQNEFDVAIPKLLGGVLPVVESAAAGAGAIVLAPKGSSLIPTDFSFDNVSDEGFMIKSSGGKTYITGKTQPGILRGVFHFLRLMQMGKQITDITENPYFPYRVLDHWWNHYHSPTDTERVYGGRRVYRLEDLPGSVTTDAQKLKRIKDYCRMAVSLGLNGICPDNVNTIQSGKQSFKILEFSNIRSQKAFADIIGTFGLKYYMSVSFISFALVNPTIAKQDPRNPAVQTWWDTRVDSIHAIINNFGGFLMKADSEGESGPWDLAKLSQAEGSAPMAKALKRYGYTLIWRTFIYGSKHEDFAMNQSLEFKATDNFDDAVILRTKDGPRDFQTREPPHQLLALPQVRHGMELQITQEYTGQAIHLCWLVPKWKTVLGWDMKLNSLPAGTQGALAQQILRGDGTSAKGGGLWGVSNLSDTSNWTAHFLHQANAYGFGRLAWNPELSADEIADEWISCSFESGNNVALNYIVKDMLKKSWTTYENYTINYSALMGSLYGPADGSRSEAHYDFNVGTMSKSQWYKIYFMGIDMNNPGNGIGVDRTMEGNNKFVQYYPTALRDQFNNIQTCPEDVLLFFHHVPWTHQMKSGMTLIQSLFHNHYKGIRQTRAFVNNWKLLSTDSLKGLVDQGNIYPHVLKRLEKQLSEAQRWFATFKSDFTSYYSPAVTCNLAITPPDSNKATWVAKGESVPLTASLKDNYNKDVSGEKIKWKVNDDPNKTTAAGGALDVSEGTAVNFSADKDGIFTLTASTEKWESLSEDIQIYVGDWWKSLMKITGTNVNRIQLPKLSMKIMQKNRGFIISAPFKGQVNIIDLKGRVMKSMPINNAGVCFWDTRQAGKGVYIISARNESQNLRAKIILGR